MTGIWSHRQAWSQFVHDWELNSTSRNQQLIDHHSRQNKCRWLGLEVNFEKSASLWEWLNTRENVDDWDLDVVMRNQQLIKNYSTLRNLLMIMLEIIVERSATQWSSLTQESSNLSMVMLGLVFERSATHWSPLKTQENVDDLNLDSPLRNQQLLDDTVSFWAPSYRLWAAPSQSSALALAWTPSMDQHLYGQTTLWHAHYFCGLASIAHLSREKSPNCLQLRTLLQPVWPHPNETSVNKFESGWQLLGFFVEGWRTNSSHLSRKKSTNCLQLGVTCMTSFKQNIIIHQQNSKSAWQFGLPGPSSLLSAQASII